MYLLTYFNFFEKMPFFILKNPPVLLEMVWPALVDITGFLHVAMGRI